MDSYCPIDTSQSLVQCDRWVLNVGSNPTPLSINKGKEMSDCIDTVEEYGLQSLGNLDYSGNFTIKYYTKEQLEILQLFFGVRRNKFDMKLLEKRPEIIEALKGYNYEKGSDNRDI